MNRTMLKERIAKVFKSAKVESILLANTDSEDPNFIYMTDLIGGLFEGNLLLMTRKNVTLFTSPLEYEIAREQLKNGIKIVNLNSKGKVEELKRQLNGKVVGINGGFVPYNSYMRLKKRMKVKRFVDVCNVFEKARQVKDNEELRRIKQANKITKKAIVETQKKLKVGMTERDGAAIFQNLILKYGADGTSFPPIVSFGRNAALPHHAPDNTRLRYGDFLLLDVGVKVKNYCSDVTRTMIFGGDRKRIKDYARKSRMIAIVKEAQRMAMASIKEGVTGNKPHVVAQTHIDKADGGTYKGTFIHSLGHSIGIDVHDGSAGFLFPGSKLVLKSGMVSSVEPGIYIPGFGGVRFEDDIVVTKKGYRIL